MNQFLPYCAFLVGLFLAVPCQGMSWFFKAKAPKPQEAVDPVKVIVQPYVNQIKRCAQRFPKTTLVLGTSALALACYKAYQAVQRHIETVVCPREKYLEILAIEKQLVDLVQQRGNASIQQSNWVSSVPKLAIPSGIVIDPFLIQQYARAYAVCMEGGDTYSYYYFTQAHQRLLEKITG